MKSLIPPDIWETKRLLITKLYKDEEWPLKQVIKLIQTRDFHPSESQLRSRLKKWHITKPSRKKYSGSRKSMREGKRRSEMGYAQRYPSQPPVLLSSQIDDDTSLEQYTTDGEWQPPRSETGDCDSLFPEDPSNPPALFPARPEEASSSPTDHYVMPTSPPAEELSQAQPALKVNPSVSTSDLSAVPSTLSAVYGIEDLFQFPQIPTTQPAADPSQALCDAPDGRFLCARCLSPTEFPGRNPSPPAGPDSLSLAQLAPFPLVGSASPPSGLAISGLGCGPRSANHQLRSGLHHRNQNQQKPTPATAVPWLDQGRRKSLSKGNHSDLLPDADVLVPSPLLDEAQLGRWPPFAPSSSITSSSQAMWAQSGFPFAEESYFHPYVLPLLRDINLDTS